MEEENILNLQTLLDQNEAALDDLQKERIRLMRQLKKALYNKTVVSAEVRKLAENAGPMDNEFFIKLAEDPEVIKEHYFNSFRDCNTCDQNSTRVYAHKHRLQRCAFR